MVGMPILASKKKHTEKESYNIGMWNGMLWLLDESTAFCGIRNNIHLNTFSVYFKSCLWNLL